jgi:hypothetical protein
MGLISRLILLCVLSVTAGLFVACGGDDEPADGDTPAAETPDGGNGDGGGGGDELSLEEYFQRTDTVFARSDQEIDALNAELEEALGPETTVEEGIAAIESFLTDSLRVLSDAADDLEALNAPEEVKEQHEVFVGAVRDASGQSEAFLEGLRGVDTEAELEQLVTEFDEETTRTQQEADAACLELQQIADDNGISVDLNCED